MNNDFTLYIACLIAIIVGVVIIKKVASCLIKTIALLIVVGLLVAYFLHAGNI